MPCYAIPTVWTLYKNATGDQGVIKQATILNADGSIKDLTSLSMVVKVWKGDPNYPLLVSENIANDGTPSDGVVNWTVSLTDIQSLPFAEDGLSVAVMFYQGVVSAPSYQDTTDPFTLIVRATA